MAVSRSRSKATQPRDDPFSAAVATFGADLAPRMRGDGRPEDRLRLPVSNLMKNVGRFFGFDATVHDEVTLTDIRSRPDIAVDSPGGRIGYIELKAPGKGTPETWRPTAHDRDQWEKLKALPNLIYTDGTSWALYRKGALRGRVAWLEGDLARAGRRLAPRDASLEQLFRDFLAWRPPEPTSIRSIVVEVAPLCRLLRDQVAETLEQEASRCGQRPFTGLALEWRNILFPVPDGATDVDETFADAYAQAVTFGLLLARVDGVSFEGRSPTGIAEHLAKQHSVLGEALAIMANRKWVGQLNVVDTLVRVIGNINWTNVQRGDADTYSSLYETFLQEYDPRLRRCSGTYYTPSLVARSIVRLVDEVLKTRLGKERGFASDDVIVLDPAMGAGTFLVEVLESAAETLRRERGSDAVPAAHLRELFANRLIGFELQAAPFAVTELRLHTMLRNRYGVELPNEEPRFLTNALDDPDAMPLDFGQLYDVLKESREKANYVKREVSVMVVTGNPPWRERAGGTAPWLEQRRDPKRGRDSNRPSMDEFRTAGHGRRAFNLSNMWTFFWRWSTWKAFEANDPAGVVALITPSAYLTSTSYAGMRRYLRATADEGWIIDLSPEGHRSSISTRIFPTTQHPVCIGIFARSGIPQPEVPATIHFTALAGSQTDKIHNLAELSIRDGCWHPCPSGREGALRPQSAGWTEFPALGDLLPWQQPGVASNRNWVWAPDLDTLRRRWRRLIAAPAHEKSRLFKETQDRRIDHAYPARAGVPSGNTPISIERALEPTVVRVAFRSFDRQYLINDRRVVDRHRPELWTSQSDRQIYVCEQHSHAIDRGSALSFATLVPNVDCFMGHTGGRVLPLFRTPNAATPNVAPGLLGRLSHFVGIEINAEDLLAYVAGVVAHSGYTKRFREPLTTPGVRVPITIDAELWRRAAMIGREVLWLHTFGERYVDESAGRHRGAPRSAPDRRPRYVQPVPSDESHMPNKIEYRELENTLLIGDDTASTPAGRVHPVYPEAWRYSVGGMQIIRKWLGYREKDPPHRRRISPLDDINPIRWTAQFDDQLLELIEVIDRCTALEPNQAEVLDDICAGPLVASQDLEREGVFPVPAAFRRPPRLDGETF